MTSVSPQLNGEIGKLGRQLADLQRRITQLERGMNANTLANASIENGALTINDGQGNPAIILGVQDDGTYAHVAVTAQPPPQPSDPAVSPAILSAMVSWDGTMAGGAPPLSDLAGVQVHCSIAPVFTPGPNTLQSTFIAQGVRPVGGLLAGYTYYICLVTVNQAGLTSPPSNIVPVVPNQAVGPGQVITDPVLIGSTTLGYASRVPRGPLYYDFEVGLQGFNLTSGGTMSIINSQAATGNQSVMITCDGATQPQAASPPIPVVDGDPVWASYVFAASIPLANVYIGIQWYDASGNFISETDAPDGTISGGLGQWWFYSVQDNAPADGTAVIVLGDHNADAAGTQFVFDAVEVSGNLGFSFSAIAGVDDVGNPYDQGITVYSLPGLQTAIAVKDAYGDLTISSIDAGGNFTGNTLTANTDLVVAGESLTNDILPPYPQGLVAWVGIPQSSLPFPASMSAVNTEIDLWELDLQTVAGREYLLVVSPFIVLTSAASVMPTLQINYTVDGSAPTTSSAIFMRAQVSSITANVRSQSMCQHFSSASGALYRFYAMILKNAATGYQIASNNENMTADSPYTGLTCQVMIYDMGLAAPQTGSVILTTTGGAASTPPKKTYTTTYNIPHTHSYQGSDGGNPNLRINNDGNCYQGGDYYDTYNGHAKTWFQLPTAMGSDLSGATINWAKMYLNNNHSWYHSGMTLSLGHDNVTSWGGSAGNPSASDYIHVGFSEGQAKWFTLPSTFYNSLRNPGSNSLVAWASTSDLSYYGYFAGAAQGGRPQIQVNYTK